MVNNRPGLKRSVKHPKDGEKRRNTAKNAERRRNTAYLKNSIIYVSNVRNYYTEYGHYKNETKKISNTVCVCICVDVEE